MTLLTILITAVLTVFGATYVVQTSGTKQPFSALWVPITATWTYVKSLFTKKSKED